MTTKKVWRAPAAVLLTGALAAASFTSLTSLTPADAAGLPPAAGASSPVVKGAASIQPEWAYREQPPVGSRQPITAEPIVERPATTPCQVQLFSERKFVPKDGAPPQSYTYTPPANCEGPWAKVVLETDTWADPYAALYDKTTQVFLDGVTIFYGTTAGPGNYQEDYPDTSNPPPAPGPKIYPRSHEETDLTEYSALFAEPRNGVVHLDNDAWQTSYFVPEVLNAGFYVSAKLLFYPLVDGENEPLVADQVRSLDPDTDEGAVLWNDSQELSYTFTDLPRNLERVYLDVQREGQRGDEFYSTNTRDTAGVGRAIREFIVKVDGIPAGVVPAYPYKYTYGNAAGFTNGNWAPVPATSAFNFIAYRVDLTPFAGVLSDGNPHTVSINGFNLPNDEPVRTPVYASCTTQPAAVAAGGCTPLPGPGYVLTGHSFWYVMGNLVMYTDHGAATTTGEVTEHTLTATPTSVVNTTSPRRAVVTHDHVISGYVDTSHGRVVTTLDQKIKQDTNPTNGNVTGSGYNTAVNLLTEYVVTTTVTSGADTSSTTVNLKYIDQTGGLRSDGLTTFGWTYSAQETHNDTAGPWVKISDLYTTPAGTTRSNVAAQRYVAFDSSGKCYDRTLSADVTPRREYGKQASITGVSDGGACEGPWSSLFAALDKAYTLNESDYTTSSWAALPTKVEAANTLVTDAYSADIDATADQMDGAAAAIVAAMNGLVPRGNPAALSALAQAADGLDGKLDGYTPDTVAQLASSLATAKAVLASADDKAQAELDAATSALQTALSQLTAKPAVMDKTVLWNVYDAARNLSNTAGAFTESSWSSLQAEIASAKQVADNASATQAEVDAAVQKLSTALAGLKPADSEVVKVKLSQSQLRLVKGKSFTLEDAVYYLGGKAAYAGKTSWKSSNTKVATVSSSGVVKAKKAGTVTITVTSNEATASGTKLSASIKVTVVKSKGKAKVTKVTASVPKSLEVGQAAYVTGKYASSKATGVKVKYASSSPGVVAVDAVGRLVAVSEGTAYIKVTASSKTKTYKVTVK